MIKRSFRQIVRMCGGFVMGTDDDEKSIHGISTDTRTIRPGNLFVPIIGERFDGHHYIGQALANGAAAALWQTDHGDAPAGLPIIPVDNCTAALQKLAAQYVRELDVRVIGITGSNGKTTTKDLVAAILATTYTVHKTEGNLNSQIGLPMTLLAMDESTDIAVLEMGMSERGQIEQLSMIAQPEAVIITNVGEAHLAQLGSREEIARAKLEILSGLKQGGLCVYNGDEPLLQSVLSDSARTEKFQLIRFGFDPANDLFPIAYSMDRGGTQFTINGADATPFYIRMLGEHNVINALAAVAVSRYMGVRRRNIAIGLTDAKMSGMRIETIEASNGLTILNDAYNASPTSMKAAIALLKQLKGYRRKVIVLGDMLQLGSEETAYHREIGKLLHPSIVDYVFTFGSLAALIADEAMCLFEQGKVKAFDRKSEIVQEIAKYAAIGDLVFVKGSRGMQLEDVVEQLKLISVRTGE